MREDLYTANKGLLWSIANRYRAACERDRAVDVEDLVQSGFIGLMEAERTFDPNGPRGWNTHAKWHVIHEIRRVLGLRSNGTASAHTDAFSLDAPLMDGTEDTYADLLPDESIPEAASGVLSEELRATVRRAVERLRDPRAARIIELCMLDGCGIEYAADDIGIDTRLALQLHHRALAALARDVELRALADLDDETRFHAHKGVTAFMRDLTSVTEGAALWRIEQREKRKRQRQRRT